MEFKVAYCPDCDQPIVAGIMPDTESSDSIIDWKKYSELKIEIIKGPITIGHKKDCVYHKEMEERQPSFIIFK